MPTEPRLAPQLRRLRNELMSPDSLKIIAERMNISRPTANVYCVHLFKAMGINSRVELMAAEINELRSAGGRQGAD